MAEQKKGTGQHKGKPSTESKKSPKRGKKRKKSRARSAFKYLLVALLLIAALCLAGYPFISNYIYENRADSIISSVAAEVDTSDEEARQAELEKAREYNETLRNGHVQLTDPFAADQLGGGADEYNALLRLNDNGVMGFIKIPKINVEIPVYHGTALATLEMGIGHLEGTSLPIGGEGTHSVLTGHTGLSSAKLFTDLTDLVEGDQFYLYIYGENLAYEVDQILVVEPSDASALGIESGQDYCTLVTCTPYGINSHRLLVRGHRVEYVEEEVERQAYIAQETPSNWMAEYKKAMGISITCFVACIVVILIIRAVQDKKAKERAKKRKKKKQAQKAGGQAGKKKSAGAANNNKAKKKKAELILLDEFEWDETPDEDLMI